MLDLELKLLRESDNLKRYFSGINDLYASGVFSFIRAMGRVHLPISNPKMETTALEGAYSAGFQDALDILLNFKEKVLDSKIGEKSIRATFGAIDKLLREGDITKEEADELKRKS